MSEGSAINFPVTAEASRDCTWEVEHFMKFAAIHK